MAASTIVTWLGCSPSAREAQEPSFLRGADLSSLTARPSESRGLDPLPLLAREGLDCVRVRLWHSPSDAGSSLPEVLRLARRVHAAGLQVFLDIHYSDTWADPGRQSTPAAWAGLQLPALADSVRSYTRRVAQALQGQGTPPRIVQLGNEVMAGMLWETGRLADESSWEAFATLQQAACAGLLDVFGSRPPIILLHPGGAGDVQRNLEFLRKAREQNVCFDAIGLSYYPWWHGPPDGLGSELRTLASNLAVPIYIVETAYPWTLQWFDDTHNVVGQRSQLLTGLEASPQGQASFVEAVLSAMTEVPRPLQGGVFYWEPSWVAGAGPGSSWENMTLFDDEGRLLPAAAVLFGADP